MDTQMPGGIRPWSTRRLPSRELGTPCLAEDAPPLRAAKKHRIRRSGEGCHLGRMESEGGIRDVLQGLLPLHVLKPREGNRPPCSSLNTPPVAAQGQPASPSGLAFARKPQLSLEPSPFLEHRMVGWSSG